MWLVILCLYAKSPSTANEASVASMVAGSGTTRPGRVFGTFMSKSSAVRLLFPSA